MSFLTRLFRSKLKTKHEIINWFAEEYNFKSYLEISTLTTGNYFDKVDSNYLTIKDCINYMLPEQFAARSYNEAHNRKDHDIEPLPYQSHLERIINKRQKYDIIFVDSFHTVEHTLQDLETALSLLSKFGIIIVHDCLPKKESLIGPFKKGAWCGQTYEGYIRFLLNHSEFENYVVDVDFGCGIIRPFFKSDNKAKETIDMEKLSDWEYFWLNHQILLNPITPGKIPKIYGTKGKSEFAQKNRLAKY